MTTTFWDVPDQLWERVGPCVPPEPDKSRGGAPRKGTPRQIFAGIVYRLRTGCQWKALPRVFGAPSTVHDRFAEWTEAGFFEKAWREILVFYDELKGLDLEHASIDSASVKAQKGGRRRDRHRRIGPSWARSVT